MKFKSLLLMLMLGVLSSSANAAMVLVGLYQGVNDGINMDGSTQLGGIIGSSDIILDGGRVDWIYDADGDSTNGNQLLNPQTSGGLTITGTVFKPVPDSTEALAGTWDWAGTGTLDYLSFKFDNWLAVYQITDGMTSGNWSTIVFCDGTESSLACNTGGQPFALSHSAGYSVVPVPAAVWLFASGLLGLIGVARKRA